MKIGISPYKRGESKYAPEFLAEVTRLWNLGTKTAEMGRLLGVTKNTVVGIAHRLGLTRRPSPLKNPPAPKYDGPPRPACEWILGDDHRGRKCGKPRARLSYCAAHAEIAFVPPRPYSPRKPKV